MRLGQPCRASRDDPLTTGLYRLTTRCRAHDRGDLPAESDRDFIGLVIDDDPDGRRIDAVLDHYRPLLAVE